MTPLQIVFLIVAAATLVSAVMVVSARRIMHAALWLVLTLMGWPSIVCHAGSQLLRRVQVVIYVGAIAILIIFAVMLTRRDLQTPPADQPHAWLAGVVSLAVYAGGLIAALSGLAGVSGPRGPAMDTSVVKKSSSIAEWAGFGLARCLCHPV
jgi:NADH-quinone oxidoreductase subunit J